MNLDWFLQLLNQLHFHMIDYLVIAINLIIFLFAGFIIRHPPEKSDKTTSKNRMLGLRAINLVLFGIYVFAGAVDFIFGTDISHLQQISQTGLTVLVAYIALHYIRMWIVFRFGKIKEIDGECFKSESYASEIVGLIGLILVGSIVVLIIINIWKLSNWLQATSVLGGILIILFASKDYFLGDLISGLIMHYNNSVEAGSVIRIKELDLIGVVLQITLSQTIIRDLIQKHEITLANSKIRSTKIETISNSGKNGFRDFLDFKIGYNQSSESVQEFLEDVWQKSAQRDTGINAEAKPKIAVVENGDHAVTWRLLYYVKIPYRIIEARNTVQTTAFELSQRDNVDLNTPVTHHILENRKNKETTIN